MNEPNWRSTGAGRPLRAREKAVNEGRDTTGDVQELWYKIRVVLTQALTPYPEARTAVMRAIEEEFIPSEE